MAYTNIPDSMQSEFAVLRDRLAKLESAPRFTIPDVPYADDIYNYYAYSQGTFRAGDIVRNPYVPTQSYIRQSFFPNLCVLSAVSNGTTITYTIRTIYDGGYWGIWDDRWNPGGAYDNWFNGITVIISGMENPNYNVTGTITSTVTQGFVVNVAIPAGTSLSTGMDNKIPNPSGAIATFPTDLAFNPIKLQNQYFQDEAGSPNTGGIYLDFRYTDTIRFNTAPTSSFYLDSIVPSASLPQPFQWNKIETYAYVYNDSSPVACLGINSGPGIGTIYKKSGYNAVPPANSVTLYKLTGLTNPYHAKDLYFELVSSYT